eukprot:c32233_g1_i1 orf=44-205(+)
MTPHASPLHHSYHPLCIDGPPLQIDDPCAHPQNVSSTILVVKSTIGSSIDLDG